jgi:hypothetical protein
MHVKKLTVVMALAVVVALTGCVPSADDADSTPTPTRTSTSSTPTPTASSTPTATVAPTTDPSIEPTPPTPAPEPAQPVDTSLADLYAVVSDGLNGGSTDSKSVYFGMVDWFEAVEEQCYGDLTGAQKGELTALKTTVEQASEAADTSTTGYDAGLSYLQLSSAECL